ncbi:amino-acid N-acetyltransferase [Malassezia caprae]|uniref:Amino-acid acetyltransferase, mitochondrial n=1 Tax=Malassezia caprae TaxID=1381934 RepID=A0AAF0EA82_9BASI|nr:amino-acid N-acetyltransferase [Malassezia caprae]
MSRVQQLILQVLQSRATRRASKSYLDMFARAAARPAPSAPSCEPAAVAAPSLLPPSHSSLATDPLATADRTSHRVPSLDQTYFALVKLQGPFTDRQLASIADGLVYLQTLGLVCAVVLDHDQWPRISLGADDSHEDELAAWSSSHRSRDERVGLAEAGLRAHMVRELWRVTDALSAAGAQPRPQAHAVVRVGTATELRAGAHAPRTPLVSDVSLAHVYADLQAGHMPVVVPMALADGPRHDAPPRCVCVDANDVMVALTRDMADPAVFDLTPVRLLVITREGGVPSHARGGHPHLMINLASEYESIRSSYIWHDTHPTALRNLAMVRDCLAHMPSVASGVLATHRSPQTLIGNLITNKAAYSPSLPPRLLAARREMRHMPTVVRAGLPVRVLYDARDIDMDRVQATLEHSFQRRLDRAAYEARLATSLDFVIVMGDYDGIAIVTREHAPDDAPGTPPIAYLDKFAVRPQLQGSGAVDFLWGALRDEVHGLGLLDALNNNGGKGGIGRGRDLVWKSRGTNVVNPWYLERSSGFVRLPSGWLMFWCDAEDRLKELAGEPIIPAGARLDDVWTSGPPRLPMLPVIAPQEQGRLERWAQCLGTLSSAWLDR